MSGAPSSARLRADAEALRALHRPGDPLVLVNVWDAASARAVAAAPGCRAIATASWSIAAAHGLPDGERIGREQMLAAVQRVAAAVELPVTADLEAGYGGTPEEVAETTAGALAVGAVGCNLEDGTGSKPLRPAAEHAARVAAAVAAAERSGVGLVVNARTDVYLVEAGEPGGRLAAALERGRAYRDAGAACIFVPGVGDPGEIGRLVEGMEAPVSVLATADGPSLSELRELGVARVSFGPGPLGVALAALQRAAGALLAGEALPEDLRFRLAPPARPA
ncbi:MAG TPA: isocitrate lyase/phosphoenolpyruvate mutase family protein [Solirubrobacteraceae bacterium]|nr:isocitrate lyase/phosphoenolpyruvate mutase family protein [Solirubrobacteraceae bacterium]